MKQGLRLYILTSETWVYKICSLLENIAAVVLFWSQGSVMTLEVKCGSQYDMRSCVPAMICCLAPQ